MSIYQRFQWATIHAYLYELVMILNRRPVVASKAAWIVWFDRTQDRQL